MAHRFFKLTCLAVAALWITGCSTEDTIITPASLEGTETSSAVDADHDHDGDHDHGGHDHDDHDHATMTFASVLERLESQAAQIKTAFDGGNPNDAHDTMHGIGHTIGDLKIAAGNDKMDNVTVASIETESEKLMDAFGALDEGMHGGEPTSYADVQSDIDSAMKSLKSMVTGDKS